MSFGLLPTGFVPKRLADVKASMEASLKASMGPGINLAPDSPLGQIVGTVALEISDAWEGAEDVHASHYPDSAEDSSLEDVAAITATVRRPATKSTVTARVYGAPLTVVPAGFVASVLGNTLARFVTLAEDTIGPVGIDEQQTIAFSATPTAGVWKLRFNETQTTASLAYNAAAADVLAALNDLAGLSAVTVTGSMAAGFVVTFAGADGEKDQPILEVVESTLTASAVAVTSTVTETVKGFLPYIDIDMEAETAGAVLGPAGSLTVVETPVSGVDGVDNLLDAEVGLEVETDSELRIRRQVELRRAGSATVEGIRNAVLAVEDVVQALAVENATGTTDEDGRPAHSIEVVVQGGDDDEVAAAIFASKGAGIQAYGTTSVDVTDSMGVVHAIGFSRPDTREIFVIANIVPNTNAAEGAVYPEDGDDLIAAAILEFGEALQIGQDVIVNQFYTPINTVPGVFGIEFLVGFSDPPTTSTNLSIAADEIAEFDSTRIEVNS